MLCFLGARHLIRTPVVFILLYKWVLSRLFINENRKKCNLSASSLSFFFLEN